jgi:hypothetical protein
MIHMPPVTKMTTGGAAAPAVEPCGSKYVASDGALAAAAASQGLLSGRYKSSVLRGAAPYMMLRFTARWDGSEGDSSGYAQKSSRVGGQSRL